ncbi:hypothetical protein CKK33_17080 [Mucilaginibacter sp. MD40]|nr:hypothetical protein CKK33_17080 [Mucilaginibacter sp. MD40]
MRVLFLENVPFINAGALLFFTLQDVFLSDGNPSGFPVGQKESCPADAGGRNFATQFLCL